MSGGSMDYFYSKLEDAIGQIRGNSVRRQALRAHLTKLVEVLRAVEWNDSGDGDDREAQLIDDLVQPQELIDAAAEFLKSAIDEGEVVLQKLRDNQ